MSSSFWSGEFYFDGIYSNLLNVCIIDFDTNERLEQIGNGVSIELNEESSFNGEKSYSESSIDSTDNITLQLCRTNGNSWSEGAIAEIYRAQSVEDISTMITKLNQDNSVHGIIIQHPLHYTDS